MTTSPTGMETPPRAGLSRTRKAVGAGFIVAVSVLLLLQRTAGAPLPHRFDETLAGVLIGACLGLALYALRRNAADAAGDWDG